MASQEQVDQLKSHIAAALDLANGIVVDGVEAPADSTPYDQAYVDEQVAKAVSEAKDQAMKDLEAAGKAKDVQEEALASAMRELADKISALSPTAPAPADGAAPSEEAVPAPSEEAPAAGEAEKSDEQA